MAPGNEEIVRTMWAALERQPGREWPQSEEELDRKLRLDLCDEEIEIRNVEGSATASGYSGHAGVRQWAVEVWEVFSELRHEVIEIVEAPDGETVVSVQRTRGRMRHSGLEADYTWAGLWKIRDGKIRSAEGFSSRRKALARAGL
jgi:ketosteroid isomerase-like protein